MPKRVLIVDDDPEIATMLSRSLLRRGFTIEAIPDPERALARAAESGFDAALLDLVMPGQDGMALALSLREKLPGLRVALLTGYTHSPLLQTAEREGMAVFIKPVVIHEIVEFLQREEG
jgi:DNA-binding NtrC family response regulator